LTPLTIIKADTTDLTSLTIIKANTWDLTTLTNLTEYRQMFD